MKYLIVGLGNMGAEYDDTRHNIGFNVVDHLSENSQGEWLHKKLGDLSHIKYKGKKLLLLKPSTYMNRSGRSIKYWLLKEKIKPENLFVIVDDLNIEFGRMRLRAKGSDGGHNGLKDIHNHIGSNYARLRIGIGTEFKKRGQIDFVLGKWTEKEKNNLSDLIIKAANATKIFTHIGVNRTMSQFNN